MTKKMLIDATHAEETRVVVVDGTKVEEFDFETVNKRQLAGNIYLAKITRVEPSLQAAFVDYGGNRHGFLAFSEIHPDYYQIPVADRKALLEEERAYARASADEEDRANGNRNGQRNGGGRDAAERDAGDRNGADQDGSGRDGAEQGFTPDAATDAAADDTTDGTDASADAPEGAAQKPTGKSRSRSRGRGRGASRTQPARDDDKVLRGSIPGMDVVDLGEDDGDAAPIGLTDSARVPVAEAPVETFAETRSETAAETPAETSAETPAETPAADARPEAETPEAETADAETPAEEAEETPYVAADHAAENDSDIESIADEDVTEEIRQPRKPRARRYKIQEVVKVRQIMLVQVVKEERGNKGAALTTYLSLPGRYCVLMPNTARGGGISRKITNAADRKKLKEIAGELTVPEGAGLIIRTAGAERTKTEIKRDYEYLMRLWEQIRDLTLKSIAPAPIYEEGNLIKRAIRDLYSRDIDEVIVEGAEGYRTAKDFMKMIMPSHAKNVKQHTEGLPLFARHGVESYLAAMFNPVVQLKSGGYIVIGVTEALVAIDVNSGRATKEGSIEETALKTNLEAAEEVARQLRLRDLAGLIVIDFIDMEERRNNAAVEKRIKDKLKTDRARIQVGRISGFGLMEMSRQRLRPGMIEATTQPCPACHGTGLIRSDDSLGLAILRQLEEEGTRGRSREVLLRAPVHVINFLMNQKREHIAMIEARYGMAVRIEADPTLVSPDFTIEKFKTATRAVPEVAFPVVSVDTSTMDDAVDDAVDVDDAVEEENDATGDSAVALAEGGDGAGPASDGAPRKKRRRRRRRKSGDGFHTTSGAGDDDDQDSANDEGADAGGDAAVPAGASAEGAASPVTDVEAQPAKPKTRRRAPRGGKVMPEPEAAEDAAPAEVPEVADQVAQGAADAESAAAEPVKTPKPRARRATKPKAAEPEDGAEAPTAKPRRARKPATKPAAQAEEAGAAPEGADIAPQAPATLAEPVVAEPAEAEPAEAEPAVTEGAVDLAEEPAFESVREPAENSEPAGTVEPAEPAAPQAEAPDAEPAAPESSAPRRRGWWSLRR
ncbi:ribonuclease E [Rhodobacteraceae bacterium MBR-64]